MSWIGWAAIIIVVGFLTYITTVIAGLFKVEEGVDVVVEFQADEVLP